LADVFISYKREDRTVAEALDECLRAKDFSTWWDTSIIAGEHFTDAIQRELSAAGCVLVLWTCASHASPWVKAEAIEGFKRNLLVAARLDSVEIGYPFAIIETADLRGWSGYGGHEGVERIMAGVAAKLGRAGGSAVGACQAVPPDRRGIGQMWVSPLTRVQRPDDYMSSPDDVRLSGAKYQPLYLHLAAQSVSVLQMTFREIEAVVGQGLPASAVRDRTWWANTQHASRVQARAWLAAGYEVAAVDFQRATVVFRRTSPR
jgi:hypothetical protein